MAAGVRPNRMGVMAVIRVQIGDPETGWPPFMDWVRAQGIDPHDVVALDIDTDAMSAAVYGPATSRGAGREWTVEIASEPPLHPDRAAR